jgi:lysophospholipase L1-like esterase
MGKTYTADSFMNAKGEDLVVSKQEGLIKYGSVGNANYNIQNWQFDTNKRLNVAVIGDSISMGAWSDPSALNWADKSFSAMLQKSLSKTYKNGGRGFIGLFDSSWWTKVGTWGVNSDYAPFGYCYTATSAASTCSLNNVVGDNIELYYVNASAVTFSYKVDGGSDVSVVSSGPYNNSIAKVSISLGTLGTHTLLVKGATVGTLFLVGASVYTGNEGVVVHNIALSGATAFSCNYSFVNRLSVMSQHFKANLVFINFLANDFIYQDNANNSIVNYTSYMNNMVSYLKSIGSDVVIWQPPKGTKLPNANTFTLQEYETASKSVAVANNCPWIDFNNDWGASNLDKMYDDVHPNEKGHKYIASLFLRVLRLYT